MASGSGKPILHMSKPLCLVIEADTRTLTQVTTMLRAAFLDTLLTSHPPKRGSSCRVLSLRPSHWFRCASTITFVNPGQPWYRWNRHSTLSKNMTLFLLQHGK